MSWTDERTATAKKMWIDGYSATQIAKQLGDVSRNAVIGKVQRLGLLKTRRAASSPGSQVVAKPSRPAGADAKSVRNRQINAQLRTVVAAAPPSAPATVKPVLRLVDTPTTTLEGLGRHACKWPIGDPAADGFGFCGRRTVETYCPDHARVAYSPRPPRDKAVRPNGKLPLWARS
ncbi:GcrA family cell cycle regulator [Caulobacter soli]|uniref:GcrA family cell cycle regulator n=1 Tax=Caulobacter soli TaxID=2708539 RepID=UPI0013EA6A8C|nr:GcrA family cell cycle regulator [Caulobacter soli]